VSPHEVQALLDLPEPLPAGEHLLWRGAPAWREVALRIVHIRAVAAYFTALLMFRVVADASSEGLGTALLGALWVAPIVLLVLGLLAGLAWLIAHTSTYVITNRRLILKIGITLPMSINLPFTAIDAAQMRPAPGGTADISLTLRPGTRLAYLILWPHVRPWRVREPQPMLRVVPQAAYVVNVLSHAACAADDELKLASLPLDNAATPRDRVTPPLRMPTGARA
jgi:hypothetical protein